MPWWPMKHYSKTFVSNVLIPTKSQTQWQHHQNQCCDNENFICCIRVFFFISVELTVLFNNTKAIGATVYILSACLQPNSSIRAPCSVSPEESDKLSKRCHVWITQWTSSSFILSTSGVAKSLFVLAHHNSFCAAYKLLTQPLQTASRSPKTVRVQQRELCEPKDTSTQRKRKAALPTEHQSSPSAIM